MTFKKYRPYLIIAAIIFLAMLSGLFADQDPQATRDTVAGCLIGIVIVLAIPIYSVDKWSLLHQSIIHFLLMAVTILPIVIFSGRFEINTTSDFLKIIGMFLLSGVAAWSIGYTSYYLISKLFGKTTKK